MLYGDREFGPGKRVMFVHLQYWLCLRNQFIYLSEIRPKIQSVLFMECNAMHCKWYLYLSSNLSIAMVW